MPVKMHFNGINAGDHARSIPIGVIQKVSELTLPDGVTHQLIAEAALWLEEFPEEIQFLKNAFANDEAPGISYELGYHNSESIGGVQWIKNIITQAATFVKTPAYGNRTRLLALAAAACTQCGNDMTDGNNFCGNCGTAATTTPSPDGTQTQTMAIKISQMIIASGLQLTDVIEALESLGGENPDDPLLMYPGQPFGSWGYASKNKKGGQKMDEKELEALKAQAGQVPTLAQKITDLEALIATKETEITTVKDENSQLKLASLLDSRTRKMVEAGITPEADAEKSDKKKTFISSLSDDGFQMYLDDLVAAKAAAVPANPLSTDKSVAALALASQRQSALPKITELDTDQSFGALKSRISRNRNFVEAD